MKTPTPVERTHQLSVSLQPRLHTSNGKEEQSTSKRRSWTLRWRRQKVKASSSSSHRWWCWKRTFSHQTPSIFFWPEPVAFRRVYGTWDLLVYHVTIAAPYPGGIDPRLAVYARSWDGHYTTTRRDRLSHQTPSTSRWRPSMDFEDHRGCGATAATVLCPIWKLKEEKKGLWDFTKLNQNPTCGRSYKKEVKRRKSEGWRVFWWPTSMTFVSSEIKRLSTTPWRRSARSGKLPCQIPLAKFPSAFWEWKLQSSKIQTEREVWYVFQASYIKDLISKAGEEVKKKKVPITRDQSAQLGEKDEKVEVSGKGKGDWKGMIKGKGKTKGKSKGKAKGKGFGKKGKMNELGYAEETNGMDEWYQDDGSWWSDQTWLQAAQVWNETWSEWNEGWTADWTEAISSSIGIMPVSGPCIDRQLAADRFPPGTGPQSWHGRQVSLNTPRPAESHRAPVTKKWTADWTDGQWTEDWTWTGQESQQEYASSSQRPENSEIQSLVLSPLIGRIFGEISTGLFCNRKWTS